VVATLAVIAAACGKVAVQTYGPTDTSGTNKVVLTADGADRYTFVEAPANMVSAGLQSEHGNLRQAFWPSSNPNVYDSQSCAIWAAQTGQLDQQGALLRITQSNGRTRAISVTKNVFYNATWIFNFHVWDTSWSTPYQQFGSTNLQSLLYRNGVVTPLPWHFCARVIDNTVEFKVWTATELEPAWGDPSHGGRATLPSGWYFPGKAGWFVGHLGTADTTVFTDLATWKYVDA
jgi:hypothetical protein